MSILSRENRIIWYVLGAMALTIFFALAVVSCNQRPAYTGVPGYPAPAVVGTAPVIGAAPVVVAAPPVVHSNDGFFSGMLMGHLLSNNSNRTVTNTTIVQRPSTVTTTAPAQRYTPPTTTYRPPASTSWTNSRSVTTTRSSSGFSVGTRRR